MRSNKTSSGNFNRTSDTDFSMWTNAELISRLEYLERRFDELESTRPDPDSTNYGAHEVRFKEFFKNTPHPIFVWRHEGDDFVRIDHNDAAQHMVRGNANSMNGIKASEYFAKWPDMIRCMHQCFEQRMTTTNACHQPVTPELPLRWFETTFVFVLPDLIMAHVHDLTDRVEAENALRESEEQLRAITDNNPSIIYLKDKDSKFLKINKAYEKFHGVTQDEALGRRGIDWLGEELVRRFSAEEQEIRSTGKPIEAEVEFFDADGKHHFAQMLKFPVLNEQGAVVAIGGTTTIVTERKLAQIELERQKSFFETLVANIPATVTMRDSDGKFLFVNKMFCDITNKSPDEFIGKTVEECLGFDSDHPLSEIAGRVLVTGEPVINIEGKSDFSDERMFSFNFVPIMGRDGKVDRLLTTSVEITEQRRREEQLRESEERYRQLIEASPDAILVARADGIIVFANSTAADLFGAKSVDQLIGLNHLQTVHPDDRAEVLARRQPVLEGKQWPFSQRRRLRLDGADFYSESRGVPFTWDGDAAILIVVRDITERRQTEEQLRQSQKMEAVGQLTGGVAHDFNNLLTVVVGNLELLSDLIVDNQEMREYTDRAISGAIRGAELTQRLLAFSRKQALNPVIIDPRRLVDDMLNLMRRALGETINPTFPR